MLLEYFSNSEICWCMKASVLFLLLGVSFVFSARHGGSRLRGGPLKLRTLTPRPTQVADTTQVKLDTTATDSDQTEEVVPQVSSALDTASEDRLLSTSPVPMPDILLPRMRTSLTTIMFFLALQGIAAGMGLFLAFSMVADWLIPSGWITSDPEQALQFFRQFDTTVQDWANNLWCAMAFISVFVWALHGALWVAGLESDNTHLLRLSNRQDAFSLLRVQVAILLILGLFIYSKRE